MREPIGLPSGDVLTKTLSTKSLQFVFAGLSFDLILFPSKRLSLIVSLLQEIGSVIIHELTLLFDHGLRSTPRLVVAAAILVTGLGHFWVIGARKRIHNLLKFEILLLV